MVNARVVIKCQIRFRPLSLFSWRMRTFGRVLMCAREIVDRLFNVYSSNFLCDEKGFHHIGLQEFGKSDGWIIVVGRKASVLEWRRVTCSLIFPMVVVVSTRSILRFWITVWWATSLRVAERVVGGLLVWNGIRWVVGVVGLAVVFILVGVCCVFGGWNGL